MKTGKIKFITKKGKGNPFKDQTTGEEIVLDKYKIGFADGSEYTFSAKGEWKYPEGSEIEFEVSNEEYKTARKAKLLQGTTTFKAQSQPMKVGYTTNDSIMFQVCYKANKEAYAKDNADIVQSKTEEEFMWMRNFLNSL